MLFIRLLVFLLVVVITTYISVKCGLNSRTGLLLPYQPLPAWYERAEKGSLQVRANE